MRYSSSVKQPSSLRGVPLQHSRVLPRLHRGSEDDGLLLYLPPQMEIRRLLQGSPGLSLLHLSMKRLIAISMTAIICGSRNGLSTMAYRSKS